MPTEIDAFIALGANLADRRHAIHSAIDALDAFPGLRVTALSTLHETDPVGPPAQGRYLNAAAALRTSLSPAELLAALLAVERSLGRDRAAPSSVRWGPRVIDLDLLLYADAVIDAPGLNVPHPRMHERRFVLAPLNQIAPRARHPVLERTVSELLAALDC